MCIKIRYGGGEVSFFYFFLGELSVSANAGIAFGSFTIDNNITSAMIFGFAHEGSFARYYHTCNPKIGIIIGPMWLKAGPSFLLSGEPAFPEMMKINGRSFNFELLYTFAR